MADTVDDAIDITRVLKDPGPVFIPAPVLEDLEIIRWRRRPTRRRRRPGPSQGPHAPTRGKHPTPRRRIHGECITLPDLAQSLPSFDYLEGFRPGRPSLYQRILVPITGNSGTHIAWTYSMFGPLQDERVSCGSWLLAWNRAKRQKPVSAFDLS